MATPPGEGAPASPDPLPPDPRPRIRVAAGVLQDPVGRILIARRPDRAHAGGFWEFPGGKATPGEDMAAALGRELAEELAIAVERAEPLVTISHAYPDRIVELHAWRVLAWTGEPRGAEGQPLRWISPGELRDCGLLPADLPIVDALLGD